MRLTSPSEVRHLLEELDIRPRKILGQNFLIDRNILEILLETADLSRDDHVLEVGPGLGVVTEPLLNRTARVTAIEKDKRLFDFLTGRFKGEDRLELLCADMLTIDVGNSKGKSIQGIQKVVSNLPYASASRILVNIMRAETPPQQMVVTLQQEVAQRLAATPGSRHAGLLSIWAQLIYRVELVKTISPTCFWPPPEIRSVIVNMRKQSGPELVPETKMLFYHLTKCAFTYRRKQLTTILSRAPAPLHMESEKVRRLLTERGLPEKARPQDLSVQDWCELAKVYSDE